MRSFSPVLPERGGGKRSFRLCSSSVASREAYALQRLKTIFRLRTPMRVRRRKNASMTPSSRIAQGVVAAILPRFNIRQESRCGSMPVFSGNVARRRRKRFRFPRVGIHGRPGCALFLPGYLPMQKEEKMAFSVSSVLFRPVMSARCALAVSRWMLQRSGGTDRAMAFFSASSASSARRS